MAARPKDAPSPTELHVELIKASEAEEARQQNEERQRLADMAAAQAAREAAVTSREEAVKREASERAAREAAQLAATAAAKREAETAKRVVRRTYAGLAAALILASVAGVSGYVARQQRLEAEKQAIVATAAATRAKLAEEQARADQKRAQGAEFDSIINECTASKSLMKANPVNPDYLNEYLSCGIRLGYALVRQNQPANSQAYMRRLTQVASTAAAEKEDATRSFYLLLVAQAAAVADCAAEKPGTPARIGAMTRLVAAAEAVLRYQAPQSIDERQRTELESRWREELFRGLLYISNFSRESADHAMAHSYSTRLLDRFNALPINDEQSARSLAKALGHNAWTALLTKRPEEAMRSSDRAQELVEKYKISDLDLVRRNRAHALLFSGRTQEASEAYQKLDPSGVKLDAEELSSAGLCHQLLNEILERSVPCDVAAQ